MTIKWPLQVRPLWQMPPGRVLRLQAFTILWMTLEAAVSLASAWHSRSPALLAFGGDSLVELLSAAVVFWRFRFAFDEARAARIGRSAALRPGRTRGADFPAELC